MAITIPMNFTFTALARHHPDALVQTDQLQELIENSNWLLAKRRRAHFNKWFRDVAPSALGGSVNRIETTSITLSNDLLFLCRLGHAKTNGAINGVRLRYMFAASQEAAAANGSIEIRVYDQSAGLQETITQAITQGASTLYFNIAGTVYFVPDQEVRVALWYQSGQATKTLTLYNFSVSEQALGTADMP